MCFYYGIHRQVQALEATLREFWSDRNSVDAHAPGNLGQFYVPISVLQAQATAATANTTNTITTLYLYTFCRTTVGTLETHVIGVEVGGRGVAGQYVGRARECG